MTFRLKNQQGIAIIESLLSLGIVGVVCFTAWFVVASTAKANEALDASDASSNQIIIKPRDDSATDDEQTYLTIKEWGVRVPLSDTSKNAEYKYRNNYAYIDVTGLKNGECSDEGATGVILRFKKADINPDTEKTYLSSLPDAPQVGQYYYAYTGPQAACSDDDAVQAAVTAVRKDLVSQIRHIEAVPAKQ